MTSILKTFQNQGDDLRESPRDRRLEYPNLAIKGGTKILNRSVYSVASRKKLVLRVLEYQEQKQQELSGHAREQNRSVVKTDTLSTNQIAADKKVPSSLNLSVPDDLKAPLSAKGLGPGKLLQRVDGQQSPRSPRSPKYLRAQYVIVRRATYPTEEDSEKSYETSFVGPLPSIEMAPPPPK